MSSVQCGLVGCGTVGSAVVRLWGEHLPEGIRISSLAVRRPGARRPCDLTGVRVGRDPFELARDPSLSFLIDASTHVSSARAVTQEALRHGKHVVTANKALVAESGPDLEALAEREGVAFRYEAAAAGAVPIVAHLRLGLSPGKARGFDGVLNGTANFILSEIERGVGFDRALRAAQEEGFAEANPERDTSGRDAADKLVILARLLGYRIAPEGVATECIDGVTTGDARFGRQRGWALRQVARFRVERGKALAHVAPCFVPEGSPLARAEGPENVIVLDAGGVGRLSFTGPGAGGAPTAAALLADVREILRSPTHPAPAAPADIPVVPAGGLGLRYVRIPGRAPTLTTSFCPGPAPRGGVSIAVLETRQGEVS